MMVAQGRAETTMKVAPPLERVPALYLLATLDHAAKMGKFPNDVLGHFWIASSSKGRDPYLPYIRIRGQENIEVAGLAYFSGDKMVGVTNPLEIGFFMAIKGMNPGGYSAFVRVPGTDKTIMFRSTHRKSNTEMTFKNGKPHFKVQVFIEGNLDEKSAETFSFADPEIIDQIEEELSKGAKKSYESLVVQTQKKGSDIFGFGEYVRAKAPAYWNRHIQTSEAWHEMYKEISVEIEPTLKIRRVGMKNL
jgi:spore germination protein KC